MTVRAISAGGVTLHIHDPTKQRATVTTPHTPAPARPAPTKPTRDNRAAGKGVRLFAHDVVGGRAELRNIGPKQAATSCTARPGGPCGCTK